MTPPMGIKIYAYCKLSNDHCTFIKGQPLTGTGSATLHLLITFHCKFVHRNRRSNAFGPFRWCWLSIIRPSPSVAPQYQILSQSYITRGRFKGRSTHWWLPHLLVAARPAKPPFTCTAGSTEAVV